MPSAKIYLYSTLGCHLCDNAKRVLWPLLSQYQFQLVEIDIANDDDLINKYATLIPVLGAANSGVELNWPFTGSDVVNFFDSLDAKLRL